MARNPYFKEYSGEQSLTNDVTVEIIKMMGKDMVYIPRTLVNEDTLFGEDDISKFDDGYTIEMYIESVNGFSGRGDILSKFGLEIKDNVDLLVSRTRFDSVVGAYENITRPREGDLIYFPLSKTLFEINFVEHENPFYQLGKLFTYKLSCETFTYNHEEIDTGISDIDKIETDRKKFAVELTLGTNHSPSAVNFFEGETVYQVLGITGSGATLGNATSTAIANDWDTTQTKLNITNIVGAFSTSSGETIKGAVSGAEYEVSSKATTTIIVPNEPETNTPTGDNEEMELIRDVEDIFDFTDTDPFSEGGY